jgi:hypothetical protein
MESNKKAFFILAALVFFSALILSAERNFLVAEKRGANLGKYESLPWKDKILLLIDDFEGIAADTLLPKEKFFSYGGSAIKLDKVMVDDELVAGHSSLELNWKGTEAYGGWGKGIGENFDLDVAGAYLNFRVYIPTLNGEHESLKILLEEDDNDNGKLEKDKDDAWIAVITIPTKDHWQMISIPLTDFQDDNQGGDHVFNVTRKGGLHTLIFSFTNTEKYTVSHKWYFDFIFFSSEKIPSAQAQTNPLN